MDIILEDLTSILEKVKVEEGPIFVHIKTQKGKGYKPAEEEKEKFHGVSPLNPQKRTSKIYSDVVGESLVKLGKVDKDIFAISAGMVKGTGLKDLKNIRREVLI